MKNYMKILRPDGYSTRDDIKKRYRELVKKNHPDLFPEERRREQNLVLMEINEAYLAVMNGGAAVVPEERAAARNDETLPVKHGDPAYAYYKTAVDHLNRGNYIFNWSRYMMKNRGRRFDARESSLLGAAREALEHYRTAYGSFLKVCTGYPGSVWVADSTDKLDYIERLNERYNEIIERLNA